MTISNQRLAKILQNISEEYLQNSNYSKLFDSSYKKGVIHDLKALGKNYNLKNDQDVLQAANDAASWNRYLLEKNFGIKKEDIKVSEEDFLILTTVLGHKGAIKYLKGAEIENDKILKIKKLLSESTSTEAEIDNTNAEINKGTKKGEEKAAIKIEKKEDNNKKDNVDISNKKVAKQDSEEKVTELNEVVVSAKKPEEILASGRSAKEISSQIQNKIDAKLLKLNLDEVGERKALKIAKKIIGNDNLAYRFDKASIATFRSKSINEKGPSIISPVKWIEELASAEMGINENKYKNEVSGESEGEIYLQTESGKFSNNAKFIMGYFADNMRLPLEENTDLIKSELKQTETGWKLNVKPSAGCVEKYLPKISDKEKKSISENGMQINMYMLYSPAKYENWKKLHSKYLDDKMIYGVYSNNLSTKTEKAIYQGFEQSKDFDTVNSNLGEYRNVSITAYKNELKQSRLEQLKNEDVDKEKIKSDITYLKNLKEEYKGSDKVQVRRFLNTLIDYQEIELLKADIKAEQKDASRLLKAEQILDKIEYNSSELSKQALENGREALLVYLKENKINAEKLYELEKVRDDRLAVLEDINNAKSLGATPNAKELPYISNEFGFYYDNQYGSNNATIGISHSSVYDFTRKFRLNSEIDLESSYGGGVVSKPLQRNYYFGENQKIDIGAEFKMGTLKTLNLETKNSVNYAFTSRNNILSISKENLKNGSNSVTFNFGNSIEFENAKIKNINGIDLSKSGTAYLTGDKLQYSFSAGAGKAEMNFNESLSTKYSFIQSASSLKYINGNLSARLSADYRSFLPSNGSKNVSILNVSFNAEKSFNSNTFYTKANYNNSEYFSSYSLETGYLKRWDKYELNINSNYTNFPKLNADIFGIGSELNLVGVKSKSLKDTSISIDFKKGKNFEDYLPLSIGFRKGF